MPDYDPLDAEGDLFHPPKLSTLVRCLHCGQEYDSYRIEWRVERSANGQPHGFWCCPISGCGGIGFGFDIFPVDPDFHDERIQWMECDEEDEEECEELLMDDVETEGSRRVEDTEGKPRDEGEDSVPW